MRAYASKVIVESPDGTYVYAVHGQLAQAMVESRVADISAMNGRVRSVRLIAPASTHALRIGEPSVWTCQPVTFIRRVKGESGTVWFEHHPRSTYRME